MNIETVFKKLYKPLCLYALHYLGNDLNSAEDVVEDCFVKKIESTADKTDNPSEKQNRK